MLFQKKSIISFLLVCLSFNCLKAQKVGVVLSGGGATGLTHIGFLQVLEENQIPIDYITGTSIGALVAGLYAAGYSPAEMERMVMSDAFKDVAKGAIEDKYVYYFKKKDVDASWISFKFSPDTLIQASLPTNLISPVSLDFSLMELLTPASSSANNNFDSLFIPFRCVAANITEKEQVVFNKGHLSEAIRASMAYPFYLKPVCIDGCLLFDGGLYNNFPADVLINQFKPDVIIGNNVSSQIAAPTEDNVLSQIKSMLTNRNELQLSGVPHFILQPKADDYALFDFNNPEELIKIGYAEAIQKLDSIKALIPRRVTKEELAHKRAAFNKKKKQIIYNNIYIDGLKKNQANYVAKLLRSKNDSIHLNDLKPQYFRLAADDKLKDLYPVSIVSTDKNNYSLLLKVKREKDMIASFGGNFSSKPINHAFVGLQYNYLGNFAASVIANSYYGKLYSSAHLKVRLDFPTRLPFYIEPELTLNRWDYFKSYATFFEEVLPSYLIENEKYVQLSAALPARNKGKVKAGFALSRIKEDYYQTTEFSQKDTADRTTFELATPYLLFERNTLNRKQYASTGTFLSLKARYVQGNEVNVPGSTSIVKGPFKIFHQWVQFKIVYENYYKRRGRLRLGYYTEGVYTEGVNSSQIFFNNYTASILSAPAFQPIPESRTLFLERFRAHSYAALGLRNIISLPKGLDLRIEGYMFQPYKAFKRTMENKADYGTPFIKRYFIGSTALVYHSPLGPASLSLNYYEGSDRPFSFLFNFGYLIFNRRALE